MTLVPIIMVAVIVGAIMFFVGRNKEKADYAKKIGTAEAKSREIIDDAIRTAENKKRETLLETKEEVVKAKNDLDREIKDRRREVSEIEKRMLKRDEQSEKRSQSLEKKEAELMSPFPYLDVNNTNINDSTLYADKRGRRKT